MNTPELLPCPFCGRKPPEDLIDTLYPSATVAVWIDEADHSKGVHYKLWKDVQEDEDEAFHVWGMHCTVNQGGCGAEVSGEGEEGARDAWNRRAYGEACRAATLAPMQPTDTLCQRLQQKCSDWGAYWRAPDAHGVQLSHEQALELLRDALGVEVEVAASPVPPAPATGEQTLSMSMFASKADYDAALSAPQAAPATGSVLTDAVHDAISRAMDEAGIKNEVLRGMCLEVGLEKFAILAAKGETS